MLKEMGEVTSEDFEPDAQLLKCLLFSLQPSQDQRVLPRILLGRWAVFCIQILPVMAGFHGTCPALFPIAIQDESTANDVGFPHAKTCDGACLPWGSLLPEA